MSQYHVKMDERQCREVLVPALDRWQWQYHERGTAQMVPNIGTMPVVAPHQERARSSEIGEPHQERARSSEIFELDRDTSLSFCSMTNRLPDHDHMGPTAYEHKGHIGPMAGEHEDHMGPMAYEHKGHVRPKAGEHEDHLGPKAGEHEDHIGPRAGGFYPSLSPLVGLLTRDRDLLLTHERVLGTGDLEHLYACMHVYACASTCMHVRSRAPVCMYTRVQAPVCMYMRVQAPVCVCKRT